MKIMLMHLNKTEKLMLKILKLTISLVQNQSRSGSSWRRPLGSKGDEECRRVRISKAVEATTDEEIADARVELITQEVAEKNKSN